MNESGSSIANEKVLSNLILTDAELERIEPGLYSVLSRVEVNSSYDKRFGNIYDRVACNRVYNRLVWGYSISRFASLTREALHSSKDGLILDLGCGSLAFTAREYVPYSERPVVLVDQSLKLLRMAKMRMSKRNGRVPENMVFVQADALRLPFKPLVFNTIISLNLLHVLPDIERLLAGVKAVLFEGGRMYCTTLVKGNRLADRYLAMWEKAGELVSRDVDQLRAVFHRMNMPVELEVKGNIAFLRHGVCRPDMKP